MEQKAQLPIAAEKTDALILDGQYETTCGKGAVIGQHKTNGNLVVIPMCCKKWTCPACAKRLARTWAKKVAEALPERFLTLTVKPSWTGEPFESYELLKKAFTKMVAKWRRLGHPFEYWSIWELQDNGYPHLHVLQKGAFIPQKWIAKFMEFEHIGLHNDIRRIHGPEGAAAYVVKYTGKAAGTTKTLLTGQRLIAYSHHFFPPCPEPTEPSKYEGYSWTYVSTAAQWVLLSLIRTFGYLISTDKFPRILELVPTGPPRDLEEIANAVDPDWMRRCYGEYESVPHAFYQLTKGAAVTA